MSGVDSLCPVTIPQPPSGARGCRQLPRGARRAARLGRKPSPCSPHTPGVRVTRGRSKARLSHGETPAFMSHEMWPHRLLSHSRGKQRRYLPPPRTRDGRSGRERQCSHRQACPRGGKSCARRAHRAEGQGLCSSPCHQAAPFGPILLDPPISKRETGNLDFFYVKFPFF